SAGLAIPCSSYQREPLRVAEMATPVLLTPMLCAVHRCPFLRWAACRRSSGPARVPAPPPGVPRGGTRVGEGVDGTVMPTLDETVGVPPGVPTRRSTSRPNSVLLTPRK